MELFWFILGVAVGLWLDFFLVLHMLKPIKKTISDLQKKLEENETNRKGRNQKR